MTAFDRVERHLPELFDELAGAGIPDYFDDMLQSTTQARQRPAWSSLERWLPMGVIARPLPIRPIPWRLFAIAAILVVLVAATLVYVGSRRVAPPPFGLARNGALLIGTNAGDIVTVDPATGREVPIISGSTFDGSPFYSHDGQRFVFDRGKSATDQVAATAMFIANADGSDAHELFPAGTNVDWFEWSPTDDRATIIPTINGKGTIAIVNLADRTRLTVPVDLDVTGASWRPNHDQFVVTAKSGGNSTFWVVNTDGSGKRQIPVSPYAINTPALSPDGTKLAYATWEPDGIEGRIRIVDIDAGGDHTLTPGDHDGYVWQNPWFSPDGTRILVDRFLQGTLTSQVAILATDGSGAATLIGPTTENPPADAIYSPDGTTIIATYSNAGETWTFDADGTNPQKAPFVAIRGQTWQRQAH
jgi:Tol biopolymer transport system component